MVPPQPDPRPILTAELVAIGSELTTGETTDTNSGELARSLTGLGVHVTRVGGLPDELDVVRRALADALGRVDLVVTTGGLGPTPDDLTREAIAAVCSETPTVDERTLDWLRGLWARRRQPFPAANVKQAWIIPSATMLPNPNGTAPGWWVDRPEGQVIVTLPGPPREMRPMWQDEVIPRLEARGVGAETAVRTLRLTGIGESQVVDRLGEALLRARNPVVATYARTEAVDVRISARTETATDGRPRRVATELADEAEAVVRSILGEFVWATGTTSWATAISGALEASGWTLATSEHGTAGALVGLLREVSSLRRAEVACLEDVQAPAAGLLEAARLVRDAAGAEVGLGLAANPAGDDTSVLVAVVTPAGEREERRLAFLRGPLALDRAAIAAAAVLLDTLRGRQPAA